MEWIYARREMLDSLSYAFTSIFVLANTHSFQNGLLSSERTTLYRGSFMTAKSGVLTFVYAISYYTSNTFINFKYLFFNLKCFLAILISKLTYI